MLSFAFDVPANGYVWTTVLNIFTGSCHFLLNLLSLPRRVCSWQCTFACIFVCLSVRKLRMDFDKIARKC